MGFAGEKHPFTPARDFSVYTHVVPIIWAIPADFVFVVVRVDFLGAVWHGEVDQVYVLVPWTDVIQLHPSGTVQLDGVLDVLASLPHQPYSYAGFLKDLALCFPRRRRG